MHSSKHSQRKLTARNIHKENWQLEITNSKALTFKQLLVRIIRVARTVKTSPEVLTQNDVKNVTVLTSCETFKSSHLRLDSISETAIEIGSGDLRQASMTSKRIIGIRQVPRITKIMGQYKWEPAIISHYN